MGKSSLLNALVGRRIAKTSGTPGKTRALNVYLIPVRGAWDVVRGTLDQPDAGALHTTHHALYFLDLPGYGYARVGQAQRRAFRGLLRHVLRRERLRGTVWLLDIRHPPSRDDRAMQEVLIEGEIHVLAALTKSDKLSTHERRSRERDLREELELPEDQMIVTSAKTGEGIEDLRAAIAGLIRVTR